MNIHDEVRRFLSSLDDCEQRYDELLGLITPHDPELAGTMLISRDKAIERFRAMSECVKGAPPWTDEETFAADLSAAINVFAWYLHGIWKAEFGQFPLAYAQLFAYAFLIGFRCQKGQDDDTHPSG